MAQLSMPRQCRARAAPGARVPLALRGLAAGLAASLWLSLAAPPAAANEAADTPAGSAVAEGEARYLRHCARCHQRDGRGIEGLYPGLRDLATGPGQRRRAIHTMLAGREDAATGRDSGFGLPMPAHGHLGNDSLAAALSYVLGAWSDGDAIVTPDEVAAVRLELLRGHQRPSEPVHGDSPLSGLEATQYVTGSGPAMTVEEFERARRLYYGRCTGCHGVLRHGTAGNPLTPELMRERGSEYLRQVIAFGATSGMPGWGVEASLSGEDIDLLARFLQHPVPQPPDLDLYQIRDGWDLRRAPAERPRQPRHPYDLDQLFVAILHDPGELALIDGVGKTLVARVSVGAAPHRLVASASGRYLYAIGRDGTVSLVDLYAWPPERVASVRVGYEARALAASRAAVTNDSFVLAGAYWPPQLVLLDGDTLEPLRQLTTRSYGAEGGYHPEPRVSDVAPSPFHDEFITHIKETGHVYLFPYRGSGGLLEIVDLPTVRELRAGSFSTDGRYYLTPTDTNAVVVLDAEARKIAAEIPARVYGGNPGIAFAHQALGPVWATSTMVGDEIVVVGTDPQQHPDQAFRVVQQIPAPGSGSLFLATHPASRHLWVDTPLNADQELSRSAAVYRRDALEDGHRSLPVAAWSGLDEGPRRVLQPTFGPDGREVWMVVWNPQNLPSAVVVTDDASLEPIAVIRRPELVTATRIYSLAALRAEGAARITRPSREDRR